MKIFSNLIGLFTGALLIFSSCSREATMQTELAGSSVIKKDSAYLILKNPDPASYPNLQIPVQAGKEYISYVKFFDQGGSAGEDSVSAVIYDPSRGEYEIFTLGGSLDSMLGHRILGMPVEDKTISLFVAKWPGSTPCLTGKPDHRMEGDKHIVSFHQNCDTKDTASAVVPGAHRMLQFEVTVR